MVGLLFLAGVIIFRSRRKVVYALMAVLLLAMAVVAMPDQYKERFASTADLSSDTGAAESARGRLEGLEHGLQLWMQSPVTGVGAGCYAIARGVEYGIYMSSHNMLAELMAESGIIGLTAFGIFIWAVYVTLRRARRWLAKNRESPDNRMMFGLLEGILVGYALLFLLGLAGHNLYRYNWFFFGALVTVIWRLVARQIDRDSSEQDLIETQSEASAPATSVGQGGTRG
jgi:O-antigen ligase